MSKHRWLKKLSVRSKRVLRHLSWVFCEFESPKNKFYKMIQNVSICQLNMILLQQNLCRDFYFTLIWWITLELLKKKSIFLPCTKQNSLKVLCVTLWALTVKTVLKQVVFHLKVSRLMTPQDEISTHFQSLIKLNLKFPSLLHQGLRLH